MKKILIMMLAFLFITGVIFAQDSETDESDTSGTTAEQITPSPSGRYLEISSELKTGLFMERIEYPLSIIGDNCINCDYSREGLAICPRSECQNKTNIRERARMHNNDDAGMLEGRFRLDLHLKDDDLKMGIKVRFQQEVWMGNNPPGWDYAYVYGNFFNDQFGLIVGMLGDSPWAAGFMPVPVGISPSYMLTELDKQFGFRAEIKPTIVPGLNFGFVLNNFNNRIPKEYAESLMDILLESVVGIAYTDDFFHGSLAYRLDSGYDKTAKGEDEGADLMYRLEEKILDKFIEGFSISANGWLRGLGIDSSDKELVNFQNWLYIDWAPDDFSSQLYFGFHTGKDRQEIYAGLSFYYNIFPWLSAGLAGKYYENFGNNKVFDIYAVKRVVNGDEVSLSPLAIQRLWSIEPQVRANLSSSSYFALVYSYEYGYLFPDGDRKTQVLNLRTVFTF